MGNELEGDPQGLTTRLKAVAGMLRFSFLLLATMVFSKPVPPELDDVSHGSDAWFADEIHTEVDTSSDALISSNDGKCSDSDDCNSKTPTHKEMSLSNENRIIFRRREPICRADSPPWQRPKRKRPNSDSSGNIIRFKSNYNPCLNDEEHPEQPVYVTCGGPKFPGLMSLGIDKVFNCLPGKSFCCHSKLGFT